MSNSEQDPEVENKAEGFSNIFVWGDNRSGQLALHSEAFVRDPIAIKLDSINMIKSIACGRAHTLIVSEAGLVFALGDNSFG